MKNNVILPDKMNHAGIFVFPVLFPFRRQVFCCRNVSDRSVKPHIQHFPFRPFNRHRHPPIQITRHCTGLQTVIQPGFTLPVNITLPFFMLFQNPLFQPIFILIQRQIPMFRLFQLGCVSRNGRHRIN